MREMDGISSDPYEWKDNWLFKNRGRIKSAPNTYLPSPPPSRPKFSHPEPKPKQYHP
jgi:hypothetical protein